MARTRGCAFAYLHATAGLDLIFLEQCCQALARTRCPNQHATCDGAGVDFSDLCLNFETRAQLSEIPMLSTELASSELWWVSNLDFVAT